MKDCVRKKASYGAGSHVRIPAKGNNGIFVFRAIVAPQNMLQAEASARDVIAKATIDGFTDQEVEEAKEGLLQAMQVSFSGRCGCPLLERQDGKSTYMGIQ